MWSYISKWWGENPKTVEMAEPDEAELLSPEPALVESNSKDFNIVLLASAELTALKRQTHNLKKRTYFFSKNNRGEFEIYCIDRGANKWPRRLKLTDELLTRLHTINPQLQTKVSASTKADTLLTVEEMTRLRREISNFDGIIFKIASEKQLTQKYLNKQTKDTYYLIYDSKQDAYELHYYNVTSKTKMLVMAYQVKNDVFYPLPEIIADTQDGLINTTGSVDPAIYQDISISEQGLEMFGNTLRDMLLQDKGNKEEKEDIKDKKHKLTSDDRRELQDLLNYYHEPLPTPDIYQKAKKNVVLIKTHVEGLMKQFIDENSYKKYFETPNKDEMGRFIFPPEQDGNAKILQYMRFINMLINMQIFMDKTSGLHAQIIQTHHLYSLMKTGTPLYSSFNDWLVSYNELYGDLEPLGAMTLLQNITSVSGLQMELKKLIPIDVEAAGNQLSTNPFYLSYLNQGENWIELLQKTDDKISALRQILISLSSSLPIGGPASENMQQTISEINKILIEFDSLSKSPKSLLDVLGMVYEVYPKLTGLIKTLPQSMESAKTVFKDHMLMTVQQMNLIFRDVMLRFDQFEIEHHLKSGIVGNYEFQDGYSINSMLTSFNSGIQELGYEFKPEERYPYSKAIHQQRNELLTRSGIPKPLLMVRIHKSSKDVEKQHAVTAKETATTRFLSERAARVDSVLEERINELKGERGSWFAFSGVREKKISLLKKLRVAFGKTLSLSSSLEYLYKMFPAEQNKLKLLWDGRTGEVMRSINTTSNASPEGIVEKVDFEIERLKKSRNNRLIIFKSASKKRLEARILALQKLRNLVSRQGYDVNDALQELSGSDPLDHQVLVTREAAFIKELKYDSEFIASDVYGKKVIDLVKPASAKLSFSAREVHLRYGYITSEINKRIKELTRELTYSFFSVEIKKHKIDLLNELKNQLDYNSLSGALENIASNKKFRDIFYLLREGRTGAMMNNLEMSQVESDAKVKYVDHAITHLKRMRSQEYSLFSEQEHFIEDRIHALSQLKEALKPRANTQLVQAQLPLTNLLATIPDQTQVNLLDKYEKDLFDKLRQWDVVHKLKREYQGANPPDAFSIEMTTLNSNSKKVEENKVEEIKEEEKKEEAATVSSGTWFYETTIANIEYIQENAKNLFIAMADEETYQQYFANATLDAKGRYTIDSDSSEPRRVHDYKQFFNMLIDAKIVFQKLNEMHGPIIKYYENNTFWNYLTQFKGIFSTPIGDLTTSYYDLYTDVDQLELVEYLSVLTNPESMKAQAVNFTPPDGPANAVNLFNNSIFQLMRQSGRIFVAADDLDDRLKHVQKLLADLEDELPPSAIAKKSTKKTIDDILNVVSEARKFANSPCKLWDVMKFVYNIYPSLNSLSKNYHQTYESLSTLSRDRFLLIMQELNLVMRDVMLTIDKFKVVNFLKEEGAGDISSYQFKTPGASETDTGVSLNMAFESFHHLVDQMGYKFKPAEQYPYHQSILDQRNVLLFENKLPRDYMLQKIENLTNKINRENDGVVSVRVDNENALFQRRQKTFVSLIDERIAQLQHEKKSWFNFFDTKHTKITLLRSLKKSLLTNVTVDVAIKEMESYPREKAKMHLLWSGRTGLMMMRIQQENVSPADNIKIIDHEIIRLNHESHKLFSMASQKDMQRSIDGLKKLKTVLVAGGYRIEEALSDVSAKFPEEYRAIAKHQKTLIKKLKDIDKHLVDFQIGKKTIDNFPLQAPEKHEDMSYIQAKIAKQVQLLEQELKDTFILGRKMKNNKIALLLELNKQLKRHSLPQALEIIARNKQYSATYKQLFLGRTGKLLKKLETLIMTPADIQERLAAEISYLKLDRPKTAFFPAEETLHKNHISILQMLAVALQKDPQTSIDKFVEKLSPKYQEIIDRDDSHLLNDIRDWQVAQKEKSDNSYRPPML